jgi:hypothetical protein
MARERAVMSDEQEVPNAAPAPEGARCALHPNTVADGICARCGNYMCAYCSERGSARECLACRERAGAGGFPFDRSNWSVFALLDYAWQVFRHYWLKLTLFSGAMLIANQSVSFVMGMGLGSGIQALDQLDARTAALAGLALMLQVAIGLAGNLGLYAWSLHAIDGKPLEVDVLVHVLRRWPQALLASVILIVPLIALPGGGLLLMLLARSSHVGIGMLLALLASMILLIPVLLYAALGVVFVTVALVQDESLDAWGAIRESWEIASGRRWRLFGAMLMLGVICLAGFALCVVGVIPALAYASLAVTCMYNALRKKEARR